MERFNLLDLKHIMIQRWGKAYGREFTLGSWQEEFLKVEKDHSKSYRAFFKEIFNRHFFPRENILVWVQIKEENLQDQNQVLSEPKNEALVIKENILRGRVLLEEKFKSPPSNQGKVLKKPNKILGVTLYLWTQLQNARIDGKA